MTHLLMTRQAYNAFAASKGKTPDEFKLNFTFRMFANHIGILEENGTVTLIKDRTSGRSWCTRREWNERTAI